MCRPDTITAATTDAATSPNKSTKNGSTSRTQPPLRVLMSLESYDFDQQGQRPDVASCALTTGLFVVLLLAVELSLRYCFTQNQHLHAILDNETHRNILARHIGVDALASIIIVCAGWSTRHTFAPVTQAVLYRRSNSMPAAGHEQRLYTYYPAAFRVALLFFAYQVKNMIDTIIWQDGWIFVFHHVFSLLTAWGCMSTGVGLMYAVFFFGMSELSTAILCLLANFDDTFGVPGLAEAFPMTKVVIGALFAVAFIVCRCIVWPVFAYYFVRDVTLALRGNDSRTEERRAWLKFFLVSLSSLSVLQIAWLGEIIIVGKQELMKVGLL